MFPLTKREYQVMRLIAMGHTNKSAGEELGCSLKTIEKHKLSVYFKWHVNSVLSMVRFAIRTCHLTPTEFMSSRIGEQIYHNEPAHMVVKNEKYFHS